MADTLITKSRVEKLNTCKRLHWYRYVLGIAPVDDAGEARDFGLMMHAALEAWWGAWAGELIDPDTPMHAAARVIETYEISDTDRDKGAVLMTGYHVRWAEAMSAEEIEVLGVEVPFRYSRGGAEYAGKIDALIKRGEKVWLVEHKTTGADLSPGATYWQRLRLDTQVSMYLDGAAALGYEAEGVIYDVIQRPEIRPLKATPTDKQKRTKGGRLYANQREKDETRAEFQERIRKLILEDPNAWYARADVVRTEDEIERARVDSADAAAEVFVSSLSTIPPRRNPDACWKFGSGSVCPYYDACIGVASVDDPTRFRKLSTVHPELEPKEEASR